MWCSVIYRYSCYIIIIKIGKNRCLMLDWPVATCIENSFHLAVAVVVFDGVFLCCPFPH